MFVRVNTGGTRLSRADLMFSFLKSKWQGARVSFDDLNRARAVYGDRSVKYR
jgi:hypothetical protein